VGGVSPSRSSACAAQPQLTPDRHRTTVPSTNTNGCVRRLTGQARRTVGVHRLEHPLPHGRHLQPLSRRVRHPIHGRRGEAAQKVVQQIGDCRGVV